MIAKRRHRKRCNLPNHSKSILEDDPPRSNHETSLTIVHNRTRSVYTSALKHLGVLLCTLLIMLIQASSMSIITYLNNTRDLSSRDSVSECLTWTMLTRHPGNERTAGEILRQNRRRQRLQNEMFSAQVLTIGFLVFLLGGIVWFVGDVWSRLARR